VDANKADEEVAAMGCRFGSIRQSGVIPGRDEVTSYDVQLHI
jgi:hypothetical protein